MCRQFTKTRFGKISFTAITIVEYSDHLTPSGNDDLDSFLFLTWATHARLCQNQAF